MKYSINLSWNPSDIEKDDKYLFCYLGVEDINGKVLFKYEFLPWSDREIFTGETTNVQVEFESDTEPHRWVLWPKSYTNDWLEKITRPIFKPEELRHKNDLIADLKSKNISHHDDVAVVTCIFNPCKYRNIITNFNIFANEVSKYCDVHVIELSFDDEPEIDNKNVNHVHIKGTEKNLMWQKERLLNHLIKTKVLPNKKYKYIAWVDSDVIFTNTNWVSDMKECLKTNSVCQLFSDVNFLDSDGKIFDKYPSSLRYVRENNITNNVNLTYSKSGFAYAGTREFFEEIGLSELHILGGSDAFMFHAFIGDMKPWIIRYIGTKNGSTHAEYYEYMYKFNQLSKPTSSYIPGEIFHLNHGSFKNRKYTIRTQILRDYDYDYRKDVRLGDNNLLEWSTEKIDFINSVKKYFYEREEDEFINRYEHLEFQLS